MNKQEIQLKSDELGLQFQFMASISILLLEKLRIMERFASKINRLHIKIIQHYGMKDSLLHTKLYLAQILSASLLTLMVTILLSTLGWDALILYYGLFITALIPFILIKGLDKKIQKRQDQMRIELPEFLSKVTLLVNAGETIQKAIIRTVEQKKSPETSYLYKELLITVHQLENNESLQLVLEDFNNRCGIQEVSLFTTTVLLNYRRGGNEFTTALQAISKDLWERRKRIARTLGEQASSKLVFPMVLIFLVILLVIATPAFMLF